MSQKTPSIVIGLLAVIPTVCALSAQEQDRWTMEFRVAAHPAEDAMIVQGSERSDQSEIHENGVLVGKWVTVSETAEEDLEENAELVTRRDERGGLELLVLIGPDDVNESDLRRATPSQDVMSGGLALALEFNDEGSAKLWNLSKKCVWREPQRRMAMTMDGKVTAAPVVRSQLRSHAQITGHFTEAVIESIRQRSEKGLLVDIYDGPAPLIGVTPLRLAGSIVVLLIVIIGSLRAKLDFCTFESARLHKSLRHKYLR